MTEVGTEITKAAAFVFTATVSTTKAPAFMAKTTVFAAERVVLELMIVAVKNYATAFNKKAITPAIKAITQ